MGWKSAVAAMAVVGLVGVTPVLGAPATVTVDQILANPGQYENRPVRVHGFATFEFENNRVWRDEAAFHSYRPAYAIHISTAGLAPSALNETKGHMAYVTGTLRPTPYDLRLVEVTEVQRDPTDLGPDRGWWSDPDFGSLVAVLGTLGFIGFAFGIAARGLSLRPGWVPRKPKS